MSGTARKLQFLLNGGKCAALKACKWALESVHLTVCFLITQDQGKQFFFIFFFLLFFNEHSNA